MDKNMNSKRIEELKAKYTKAQYVIKDWTVDPNDDITLEDYGNYVDPLYKHVSGNATIIEKQTKKGKFFYKMAIPLEGGGVAEWELSYNEDDNGFDPGDEILKESLVFRTEKYLEREHSYATGELA